MGTTRFGNLSGSQTPGNKLQSNLPYRTPQTSVKPVFSHFSVQPRNVRKRGGRENPSWPRHCERDTKIMVSVTEQNSLRWLFCRSYKSEANALCELHCCLCQREAHEYWFQQPLQLPTPQRGDATCVFSVLTGKNKLHTCPCTGWPAISKWPSQVSILSIKASQSLCLFCFCFSV